MQHVLEIDELLTRPCTCVDRDTIRLPGLKSLRTRDKLNIRSGTWIKLIYTSINNRVLLHRKTLSTSLFYDRLVTLLTIFSCVFRCQDDGIFLCKLERERPRSSKTHYYIILHVLVIYNSINYSTWIWESIKSSVESKDLFDLIIIF